MAKYYGYRNCSHCGIVCTPGNYLDYNGKRYCTACWIQHENPDHPELDDTEFLDINGIQMYQSLIGAGKWAVSLGRFDISTAIMTMSKFRTSPRKGHLDRVRRIYG